MIEGIGAVVAIFSLLFILTEFMKGLNGNTSIDNKRYTSKVKDLEDVKHDKQHNRRI